MSFRITGMAHMEKFLFLVVWEKSRRFQATYLSIVERQESKRNAIGIEGKVTLYL